MSDSGRSRAKRTPEHALLDAAEEIAHLGSYEWIPETSQLHWTDNLFRIFGLEPGQIEPDSDFWLEHIHPDDREPVERSMERFEQTGEVTPSLEYRFVRPDGEVRSFRSTATVFTGDDGLRRIIGPIQDVTDLRREPASPEVSVAGRGEGRSLTTRELEVLQLAAYGLSGREIAQHLAISPSTVKTHFNHIYEKLGVSDRAAAVATALRVGIIE
jgi:PAS domain S-box-containing protein